MEMNRALDSLEKRWDKIEESLKVIELKRWCKHQRLYSVRFKQVETGYYDRDLSLRAIELGAVSSDYLCKTMMIESGGEMYLVVLQYDSKINYDEVAKLLGKRDAKLADLDISEKMTGYKRGSITPFNTTADIPVILSQRILSLKYVWLGGGAIDVKMEISVEELLSQFNPLIGYIADFNQ